VFMLLTWLLLCYYIDDYRLVGVY